MDPETLRVHCAMLDDRSRTGSFINTLRRVVRPGDVVIDLGSGTGVLAVVAAKCGAARVYAIEAGPLARWAQRVCQANGVSDVVTVVRGWSRNVSIPVRGDVLVGELVGDEPLSEGILGSTSDAVRRFMKPRARMIPSRLRICCSPMLIPRRDREERIIGQDRLSQWRSWYGINFEPLAKAWGGDRFVDFINPIRAADWTALGPPALIADYDLRVPRRGAMVGQARLTICESGRLDAILFHFELRATGLGTFLSTQAQHVGVDNHWFSPLRLLHNPQIVTPGDEIVVNYSAASGDVQPRCRVFRQVGLRHWAMLE